MKGNVTMTGYWPDSPDRNNDFNVIPSNNITMKRMKQPLVGVSDTGDTRIMNPGEEHQFDGNYVLEMPLNNMNGKITDPTVIQRLIDNHRQMRNGGSLRTFQGDIDPSTVTPVTGGPAAPVTGVPFPYAIQTKQSDPYAWNNLLTNNGTINGSVRNSSGSVSGDMRWDPESRKLYSSFPIYDTAYQTGTVGITGKPSRATQYAREFMAQNPDPDAWTDSTDPNSPVAESFFGNMLGIGQTETNPYTGEGWGVYNRKANYENAKADYMAEKLLTENPQGDRSRQEWLASFTPGELAALQQSRKYSGEVAPNKWKEGFQGLNNFLGKIGDPMNVQGLEGGYEGRPENFKDELSSEEAQDAGITDALGMVTIPAEGLKGWITEGSGRGWSGASPIDYTGGRDVVLDTAGDAILDPLNLVGVGIGEQAVKGVRAAKPFIQAGTEIGTRGVTGLLNKTGSFLESKAGLLNKEAIPAYQMFNDVDPNITARAASTNTIGGAFDYRGRTHSDMYDAVLNSNLPDDQLKSLLNEANARVDYTSKTKAEFLADIKPLAEQDAKLAAYPETVRQEITTELSNQNRNWKNLDTQERDLILGKIEQQYGAPSSVNPIPDVPAKEVQTLANYSGGELPPGFKNTGSGNYTSNVAKEDLPSTITYTKDANGVTVAPNNPIPGKFNGLDEAKTFFANHAENIGLSAREKKAVNDNIQAIYDTSISAGDDPARAVAEVRTALDRMAFSRMDGRTTISGFDAITTMPKNAKQSAKVSSARNGYNTAQTKSLEKNIELATERLINEKGLSKEEAFRQAHGAAITGLLDAQPMNGWVNRVDVDVVPPNIDELTESVAKAFDLSKQDTKLLKDGYNDIIANIDENYSYGDPLTELMQFVNKTDNPFDVINNARSYGYNLGPDYGGRYQKAFGKFSEAVPEKPLEKFMGKINTEIRAGRRAGQRDEFVTPLTKEEFKGGVQKNKQGIIDLNNSAKYTPSIEKAVTDTPIQATSSLFAKSFDSERKMLEHVTSKLDEYLTKGKTGDIITGSTSTSHNSYVVQMDYIMKTIKNPANAGKLEPAFLGFKSMNPYGYMSKARMSNEEILKLINNKLNSFQKKTGVNLQFEDKFPYINAKGEIMLPQWGIKKLTDAPIVAKKKYGGEVSYNEKPFLGYIPFDYTKAYGL